MMKQCVCHDNGTKSCWIVGVTNEVTCNRISGACISLYLSNKGTESRVIGDSVGLFLMTMI